MESGTRLGPYEILEQLGAGGMGEVWLAEDTRLHRKVAIKVLPEDFAGDPERLARFEREARAAAALNHPHIAAVHDVGVEGGTHFMVQEYLQGQSLRVALGKGALPLDKALELAIEISEALAAAHKAGIVHRDLKPDNIFVTEEGHAKVLDFGLAKLTESVGQVSAGLTQSPTMLGTVAGQIMGTAGYMAPEQVTGDADVDHRADIFSFGLLIYEATAGRQAFAGRSVMQTLDLIAHEEAEPLVSIVPSLPAELERIVRKTMVKDRDRRYQSAVEIGIDLKQLQEDIARGRSGGAESAPTKGKGPTTTLSWRSAIPGAIAMLVAGYLLGGFGGDQSEPAARETSGQQPTRFTIPVDGGHTMSQGFFSQLAVSPDGRSITYVSEGHLWLRVLDEDAARPVAETDNASQPFFSPDGEWVGFYQQDRLMRYRVQHDSVSQLVDHLLSNFSGASWGEDGSIIVGAMEEGLLRIAVGGHDPERLIAPLAEQQETGYSMPQSLDGGDAILYTALGPSFLAKDAEIVVYDVATGARTVVVERGTRGRYVPTGHVVYVDGAGTLMAIPFDLERREAAATTPVPVETGIRIGFWAGGASFDVSAAGTLVFVRGSSWENQLIKVVDRTGATLQQIGGPLTTDTISLSRDGSTVAVDEFRPDNADIYTYDVESGGRVRVTRDDAMEENGIVSPNADRVAYMRTLSGNLSQIVVQSTATDSPPEVVHEGKSYELPQSWDPTGRYLVFSDFNPEGLTDLAAIDTENPGQSPIGIATTERRESPGDFSTDGRYYAYDVDQTVIVTPFPELDRTFEIDDAWKPRWTRDELFFLRGTTVMAMPISTTPAFERLGDPEPLFGLPILLAHADLGGLGTGLWPFPDGQRFLIDVPNPDAKSRADKINVVLDWSEELKRRVPTER